MNYRRIKKNSSLLDPPRRRSAVTTRLAIICIVLAPAAAAQGQVFDNYFDGYGGGYGYSYHSSTAEEGIQRGYADIVRSQGMANLLNSKAAKEWEQARKDYIDNRLRATQTYFEMRRVNEDYRASQRSSPLSMEAYVRLARQQAPDPLSTSQLDSLSGAIGWPAALRKEQYGPLRQQLDKLFQQRAGGHLDYQAIHDACTEMIALLKNELNTLPSNEYLAAKKFLESLDYTARITRS
jgi:hypothetical protein